MIYFQTENQLYASVFNTREAVLFMSNPARHLRLNPGASSHSYLSRVRRKERAQSESPPVCCPADSVLCLKSIHTLKPLEFRRTHT